MPLEVRIKKLNIPTDIYRRKLFFIPIIKMEEIIIKEDKVNKASLFVGAMEARYIKIRLKAANKPPLVTFEVLNITTAPLATGNKISTTTFT
jgi:hypothetical protein